MATGPVEQRNQDATCYVGNLDEQLTEELLWEMMPREPDPHLKWSPARTVLYAPCPRANA